MAIKTLQLVSQVIWWEKAQWCLQPTEKKNYSKQKKRFFFLLLFWSTHSTIKNFQPPYQNEKAYSVEYYVIFHWFMGSFIILEIHMLKDNISINLEWFKSLYVNKLYEISQHSKFCSKEKRVDSAEHFAVGQRNIFRNTIRTENESPNTRTATAFKQDKCGIHLNDTSMNQEE